MNYLKGLAVFFVLFSSITLSAQVQIGQEIVGETPGDHSGKSISISADGTRVAIGADLNNGNGPESGHVRIYEESGGVWTQVGSDIDGEANYDHSGSSVSLSADGTRVAIGAPENSGNGTYSGHVRIYEESGGVWAQLGSDIDGEVNNDGSGWSVSLSANGTRVAIGSPDAIEGKVQIFEENGGVWTQVGSNIIGNLYSLFGSTISLSSDGTRLAIGSPEALNYKGLVRIYEESGGVWTQVGSDFIGESPNDELGWSISLSADGTTLAIGDSKADGNGSNAGQVRVYEESGGVWTQVGSDIDGEAPGDFSGSVSLSADGTKLANGAGGNDGNGPNSGQVRIYQIIGGEWAQLGNDIDGEAEGDAFTGVSISADGSRFVASGRVGNGFLDRYAKVYELNGLAGQVYLDINENCVKDNNEIGIEGRTLLINPGNYVAETNHFGGWDISALPTGNYTITVDTSDQWSTTCPISQSFTVTNPNTITTAPSIGLVSNFPCTAPAISIDMPFMRPCFSNQYIYTQACNTNDATGSLLNPYVIVSLDSLINPTDFELPYTDLGNNEYQIDFDSLVPGECRNFWIKAMVDCNAQLGQGLCLEAELYPLDSCALDSIPNPFPPIVNACTSAWDNSSLSVEGNCANNTIYFVIMNNGALGNGNMTCYSPVTVYIDGVLFLIDSVLLAGQETFTYSFPATEGESFHLEVAQHPLHPGNSQPNATVENCIPTSSESRINEFAHDDADPMIDIYCGIVTGSYDPNDKTGYPLGTTDEHFIKANQQIQYRIRFQNTGTDTAFTVVIRDTLETDLDIFSVQSGVSSHAYDFKMYGPRVLEWTFNNILLPDSTTNEVESHGFVWFSVDQYPNLPEGRLITNSAGIYFDFNDPIITNVSEHQIHYEHVPVSVQTIENDKVNFQVFPNPTSGDLSIDLGENYEEINLTVYNILGQKVQTETIVNKQLFNTQLKQSAGIYLLEIRTSNGDVATVKIVLE